MIHKKHRKTCKYLNYVQHFLIEASTVIGCVFISVFASLVGAIENNYWSFDLFELEVGPRGYCSRSILCCFKSLDLRTAPSIPQ